VGVRPAAAAAVLAALFAAACAREPQERTALSPQVILDAAAEEPVMTAPVPDAGAAVSDGATPEAAVPMYPMNCGGDTYFCRQYDGVLPTCDHPLPGPCPIPVDPSTDICVQRPGVLEFYYHTEIPDPTTDASIPYGPSPPADCVHPG
jgi:hypothetical protein